MSEPRHESASASGPSREGEPQSFWWDGRAALTLAFCSPVVLFIFGGLTFVTALLLLDETGLQGVAYLHPDRTQFWHMLVALAPTIWVTALLIVLGDSAHNPSVWPPSRSGRLALLFCLIPLLLLLALPHLTQLVNLRKDPFLSTFILPRNPSFLTKRLGMSLLGVSTAAVQASAIVGIHLQLLGRLPRYQQLGEPLGAESLDEDVLWYQRRQAQLRQFLRLASAILGVSILAAAAHRHLINATLPSSSEPIPTAPVLSYGLYYTGLIASLYAPASNTLKKVGEALAERLVWQSIGAHPTWKQRLEEQQAIRNQLGLQGSALEELQQGLAVLAPFLASISSLALGTGG